MIRNYFVKILPFSQTKEQKPSSVLIDLIYMIACFIAYLPNFLQSSLSNILSWLRFRLAKKQRIIASNNLYAAYNLPKHSYFSQLTIRQVFHSQIQIGFDTITESIRPGSLKFDGLEELRAAVQKAETANLGGIVITAHLGSWDFVGQAVSQASKKSLNAIAKPSSNPVFNAFLETIRKNLSMKVIWTGAGAKTLKEMTQTLKDQLWLGFVMDQKPLRRKGPEAYFFGQKTSFVSGPAIFAAKFQTPVLAIFCVRTAPKKYRFIVKSIVTANHGITDPTHLTEKFAQTMESTIKIYPEQWAWDYKRWRI